MYTWRGTLGIQDPELYTWCGTLRILDLVFCHGTCLLVTLDNSAFLRWKCKLLAGMSKFSRAGYQFEVFQHGLQDGYLSLDPHVTGGLFSLRTSLNLFISYLIVFPSGSTFSRYLVRRFPARCRRQMKTATGSRIQSVAISSALTESTVRWRWSNRSTESACGRSRSFLRSQVRRDVGTWGDGEVINPPPPAGGRGGAKTVLWRYRWYILNRWRFLSIRSLAYLRGMRASIWRLLMTTM